ncbi:hypothetical protein LX15_000754 [Streptoalloteichus tenebrarius]|uniref:Secreted protein n=1 Tax=Streptoalloteichus tenebrarius (strain ATCC 17920 / DSM 40477 / JCM 4838 / CBS 697.72 / NBRC 16177 / NCIMB 11028 / NRRL B-12390 / A12253. 1 / ISP 5477) TaxID=1933 RepID=A0ABT1HNI0_STRSD|nr:hypothetical protein [Streptoalloteichus tenebrarius]MCP2257069.1 hypothetical protein [Streptoalloteichus tenebrarius]BFE98700.1 hypothetical protein GCM10020241_03760 [Streptoalloteichus tenebrarius]
MVNVRRYTRRDGTTVRAHTRSAPRRGGGGAGLLALIPLTLLLGVGALLATHREGSQEEPTAAPAQQVGPTFAPIGVSHALPCGAHAYGEVKRFLDTTPCLALARALYEASEQGHRVLVAVAWAEMPDRASADALKELADREGSGNITELSQELPQHAGTRFTGRFYRARTDGATTVIAQSEPLTGTRDEALLDRVTQAAAHLPRPTR